MHALIKRPVRPARPLEATNPQQPQGWEAGQIRFVPARWLVVALAILRLLVIGGPFRKLRIAGLVWSVAPRTPKLIVLGLAFSWLIVVAGALAAIALLALSLG
jgi:hypothetical protein